MLTQKELKTLLNEPNIKEKMQLCKAGFTQNESKFDTLSDDDFIALVLLTPSIGIALAHGTISLFEEMSLNKKVRMLSQANRPLENDTLFYALRYLQQHFSNWESPFYELIRLLMYASLKKNPIVWEAFRHEHSSTDNLEIDALNAPYIFVKMMSFLFLEDGEDLMATRSVAQAEYDKILAIGKQLQLENIPLFQQFCANFDVR